MAARLTKQPRWCKACFALALLLSTTAVEAETVDPAAGLRDCVAAARDAAAIIACEKTEQAALVRDIARWTGAIRRRLEGQALAMFDQNIEAWQAYIESEQAMIDYTLAQRTDGLANRLRPGLVTRLYEVRERRLREHLHNLNYASRRPAAPSR